jgi:hypothetical protein
VTPPPHDRVQNAAPNPGCVGKNGSTALGWAGRAFLGALAILIVLGVARPVAADQTREVEARLAQQERSFQRWRWAWAGIYSALTIGNLALVPFTARKDRIDLYVGATTSAIGIPPLFLFPQPRLGEPCGAARLTCAEQKLTAVAAFQREARGWVPHVATFAVNAAAGAVLGFGYQRWRSAALAFGAGMAIGEVQIFTAPRGALP